MQANERGASSIDDRAATTAAEVEAAGPVLTSLADTIASALRGKDDVIQTALICVLAEGHLLLDDVPGVGKTLLAKSMAAAMGGAWSRVQFTPDLLPADVTGISVWQPRNETFVFRPGPVFANLLVCDEINRGPAKTQAALLEAMEERAVTADGTTYQLARPFLVVATQNPYEQEGTYNLPESQLDRFLVRSAVGYPNRAAEVELLTMGGADSALPEVRAVTSTEEVGRLVAMTANIYLAPTLFAYVADLVRGTRTHADASLGVSPRGGLALLRASRARAVLDGRAYVTPDDVRSVAHLVLDHRILVRGLARWNREASGAVIDEVLEKLPVPGNR